MVGRVYPPVGERLAAKTKIDENGCHLWQGHILPSGYAQIRRNDVPEYVHRVAYEIHHNVDLGRVREGGALVCHKCDVRHCVNPDHLFLGSNSDNMQDMIRKGRSRKRYQFGSANSSAKLTDEIAAAIRDDKRSGREIAKAFGISQSTVSMIRNGKRWPHLKDRTT